MSFAITQPALLPPLKPVSACVFRTLFAVVSLTAGATAPGQDGRGV